MSTHGDKLFQLLNQTPTNRVQVVEAALQDAQLGIDAVDWLLLHQANQRILDSASQRLKVGSGTVIQISRAPLLITSWPRYTSAGVTPFNLP
jgi:3-oxoacyl-[acyl-carrier-protein] synthase III